jgi:hypothetical protein
VVKDTQSNYGSSSSAPFSSSTGGNYGDSSSPAPSSSPSGASQYPRGVNDASVTPASLPSWFTPQQPVRKERQRTTVGSGGRDDSSATTTQDVVQELLPSTTTTRSQHSQRPTQQQQQNSVQLIADPAAPPAINYDEFGRPLFKNQIIPRYLKIDTSVTANTNIRSRV